MKKISFILLAVLLASCKITPDWTVNATYTDQQQHTVVWLEALTSKGDAAFVVSERVALRHYDTTTNTDIPSYIPPHRQVDVVISEVSHNGVLRYENTVDFGDNESVVAAVSYLGVDYVLLNTSDGNSHIVAFDHGVLLWKQQYQDGSARDVIVEGGKLVVTGKVTAVYSLQGELLWSVQHTVPMWSIALGLWGEVFIGGSTGVYAYNPAGVFQWYWPSGKDNLTHQSQVLWQNGVLYHAVHTSVGDKVWVKSINAKNGTVMWEKAVAFDGHQGSTQGFLMISTHNDNILVAQSDRYQRQVHRIDPQGRVRMVVNNSYGTINDIQVLALDEWVMTGNGVTEYYDAKGNQLFWVREDGEPQYQSGQLVVLDNTLVIGQSVALGGEIQGVLSGVGLTLK